MRARVVAPVVALVVVAVGVSALLALNGDDADAQADVAGTVGPQLSYLDPDSALVAAVDMRFDGANWAHLRTLASRVLREYRSELELEERTQVPPNATGGLELLARSAGLSFEQDVQPVLDGYLVAGVTLPARPPLPARLERLAEALDGATFDPRRRGYVRFDPQAVPGRRAPRAVLVRERDGSRITRSEGDEYFEAQDRRRQAVEPRFVVTYHSPEGGLRRVVDKLREGERPRKLAGYEDTVLVESGLALVGDDTLVLAEGEDDDGGDPEDPSGALRAALDRARRGDGYPPARLASAQDQLDADDPFVLAAGEPELVRAAAGFDGGSELFDEQDLARARRRVPYLGAIGGVDGSLEIDEDRVSAGLRVKTDASRLEDEDLPLAAAGPLELPDTELVAGGSRDQSVTTTFATGVARSLFAGSDFVRAVERTERALGVRFEDELLRQFDCPSISVFDARRRRFGARSCLRDPDRMRALLPRLRPHLPRIVRGLRGLGDRGLLALLLVAPDAPAIPGLTLAQIDVAPVPRQPAGESELLYEMSGLRDDVTSDLAQVGPERVVFGMIGDRFVVASDRALARQMADLPTRRHSDSRATALRVPAAQLLTQAGATEARVAARVLGQLVLDAEADRGALRAHGVLSLPR